MTQELKIYEEGSIFLERINPLNKRHKNLINKYFPKNNIKNKFCLFSHLFRSHLNDYFVFDKETKEFKGYIRIIPFMNFFSECEVIPLPFSIMNTKDLIKIIKDLPIIGHLHTEQGSFHPFSGDIKINPYINEATNKKCKGFYIKVPLENLEIALNLLNEGFQISFVGHKILELSYNLHAHPLYISVGKIKFNKTLDSSGLRENHMKKIGVAKESYEKKFIIGRYRLLNKLSQNINASKYTH